MSQRVALVTGASGEMGNLLLPALRERGFAVTALDLVPLSAEMRALCTETVEASLLDFETLGGLIERHPPDHVFHLAAVLSSKAERDPDLAHRVNVQGTYDLLHACQRMARERGADVRFLFPSSIAVYGLPDAATKEREGALREWQWTAPTGMYGCNKLYCELLGSHLSRTGRTGGRPGVDFRAIRFPGLISAETLPSGGTTDYAPEMIHAAASGRAYRCFVEAGTRLPFMTMPDAVDAALRLVEADEGPLTTRVYNIRAFSASAAQIRDLTLAQFPGAEIGFEAQAEHQAIVDSWPADVDDTLARRDWGLDPRHGLEEALGEYLVPALRRRYAKARAES
jgi:nucleoside-diphosphate-sugar epimerase